MAEEYEELDKSYKSIQSQIMIINRSSPESKVRVGKEEPLGETEGARVGVHPAAELLEVNLVLTLKRKECSLFNIS